MCPWALVPVLWRFATPPPAPSLRPLTPPPPPTHTHRRLPPPSPLTAARAWASYATSAPGCVTRCVSCRCCTPTPTAAGRPPPRCDTTRHTPNTPPLSACGCRDVLGGACCAPRWPVPHRGQGCYTCAGPLREAGKKACCPLHTSCCWCTPRRVLMLQHTRARQHAKATHPIATAPCPPPRHPPCPRCCRNLQLLNLHTSVLLPPLHAPSPQPLLVLCWCGRTAVCGPQYRLSSFSCSVYAFAYLRACGKSTRQQVPVGTCVVHTGGVFALHCIAQRVPSPPQHKQGCMRAAGTRPACLLPGQHQALTQWEQTAPC
jgi:hypothetical protein